MIASLEWRTMRGLLLCLPLVALGTGCSRGDTPEPDRVVNIERKCEWFVTGVGFQRAPQSFCEAVFDGSQENSSIREARLRLTIRTAQGTTYEIDVDPRSSVRVGDQWP